MSIATDLCRMSATELAEAIRSGQVSSHEVVEAHLRRIEEVNPAVNAVPVVPGEQALEAARAANRAAARGGELPPLHGVPFTVKGNIDLADTPTTYGIKALVAAVGARRSSGSGVWSLSVWKGQRIRLSPAAGRPAVHFFPHRTWVPGLWVEIPCLGHRGLGSLII